MTPTEAAETALAEVITTQVREALAQPEDHGSRVALAVARAVLASDVIADLITEAKREVLGEVEAEMRLWFPSRRSSVTAVIAAHRERIGGAS